MSQPLLLIFAGPNGSGKSSCYEALTKTLPPKLKANIVNPDVFALKLTQELGFNNTNELNPDIKAQVDIEAGKLALKAREQLLANKEDLIIETTASSTSLLRLITKAKQLGYFTRIVFMMLNSPQLNITRIKHRVSLGGHFIDDLTVQRRYDRAINLLPQLITAADHFQLFDNSTLPQQILLKKANHDLMVNTAVLSTLAPSEQDTIKHLLSKLNLPKQS